MFAQMTRVNTLLAFAVFGALGACDMPAPSGQAILSTEQVSFFASDKLNRHSDIKLTAKAQEAFREFRDGSQAYGAYYTSPDGKSWGWHRGRVTMQTAQDVAKTVCEANLNVDCVLYATLTPSKPPAPNALPRKLEKRMKEGVEATVTGNYMAIALSPSGPDSIHWNYKNAADARQRALESCREQVKKQRAERLKPHTVRAMQAANQFNCRIIATYRAP